MEHRRNMTTSQDEAQTIMVQHRLKIMLILDYRISTITIRQQDSTYDHTDR